MVEKEETRKAMEWRVADVRRRLANFVGTTLGSVEHKMLGRNMCCNMKTAHKVNPSCFSKSNLSILLKYFKSFRNSIGSLSLFRNIFKKFHKSKNLANFSSRTQFSSFCHLICHCHNLQIDALLYPSYVLAPNKNVQTFSPTVAESSDVSIFKLHMVSNSFLTTSHH